MDVGKRLLDLRNRCWLTQNGLAEKAGVSQTHLRRVERWVFLFKNFLI